MRLWSLHPKYLDAKGLIALWREVLLAQAVLENRTQGYRHHPQLKRFRNTPSPLGFIAAYLQQVHAEATRRGYCFDIGKIKHRPVSKQLTVTNKQLAFEWRHLRKKLAKRAPRLYAQMPECFMPQPHPLFLIVPGAVEDWERADT